MFGQSNTVEFDLIYDFSVPGETHRMSFIVVLPQTIPNRQKILSRGYSPKPSRIFDENGNRYAEFVFDQPQRHAKIKICVKAELFRHDLLTARMQAKKEHPADYQFTDFLRHERYIEKDDQQIQEIADGIEGRTEIDVVKDIYDYVLDNMEYVVRGRRDQGAVRALEQGRGDCTEYSDLFVAICRAKDIPARVVAGYTVRVDTATSKHNWAEVYLQNYGWVPFDLASGDVENVLMRGRAFSRLRPVYIYLSHIRNEQVLGYRSFGRYKYWGDKVRFTDSIEFKRPAQPVPKTR
jgi:transglutaminase-like putative cysteine protease